MKVSLRRTGNRRRIVEGRVLVEPGRAVADLGEAHADADRVVVAAEERLVHGQAGVQAEVDQVAVLLRRAHRPDEDVDVAVGIVVRSDRSSGRRRRRSRNRRDASPGLPLLAGLASDRPVLS